MCASRAKPLLSTRKVNIQWSGIGLVGQNRTKQIALDWRLVCGSTHTLFLLSHRVGTTDFHHAVKLINHPIELIGRFDLDDGIGDIFSLNRVFCVFPSLEPSNKPHRRFCRWNGFL